MNKIYSKKIIGTFLFSAFVVGVSLAGFSLAGAHFFNGFRNIHFDGIVNTVNTSNFEMILLTSGTDPVTVQINEHTVFTGGLSYEDILLGDHLKVFAKTRDGVNIAKVVRRVDGGTGYGTAGDMVHVSQATVVSKTADTFTVDSGTANITFRITSATRFIRTNFSSLSAGDSVMVNGTDSGTEFLAKIVVKRGH